MMTALQNDILILRGEIHSAAATAPVVDLKLRKNQSVTSRHLRSLADDLQAVLDVWDFHLWSKSVLVTAVYRTLVAKTNRITCLLKPTGCKDLSELVCGARLQKFGNSMHHVLVYKVDRQTIEQTIKDLRNAAEVVDSLFSGEVTRDKQEDKALGLTKERLHGISKTRFLLSVKDAFYLGSFKIGMAEEVPDESQLVSLYRIGDKTELQDLLHKIGIRVHSGHFLNEDTLLLDPAQRKRLGEAAGWLIAMEVTDVMSLDTGNEVAVEPRETLVKLPKPGNEPVIGVIDTQFDTRTYFSDWVEYHNEADEEVMLQPQDFRHGTAVTSLIVNGPVMNPELDDGCGLFRVRHFGVATHSFISNFAILKKIRRIVEENQDIRVWNLSLGSKFPVSENFISPEAAELDRIQKEFDVLFVVAGTNGRSSEGKDRLRIGAPADSLNALVVNACDRSGAAAPYSRCGPVLHYFTKPDLCTFGGVMTEPMSVCTNTGQSSVYGTSFAAPWVARKAAWLVYKMKMSLQQAKALLIDSCVGWNEVAGESDVKGWGRLPQRIDDIVRGRNDEIRFIISGVIEKYRTYGYNIPVPKIAGEDKHDYWARITLCYFPECRREQGVDYSLTELDLHFGRVSPNKHGEMEIRDIKNNKQAEAGSFNLPEADVRSSFQKWDNVKVRRQMFSKRYKAYTPEGFWGFNIYAKERLKTKHGTGLPFSVVVTLRSMDGKNRQSDFIRACQAYGWLVSTLDVHNRLTLTEKSEGKVKFE